LEVSIHPDPQLLAARASLDEAARLGTVPSWLMDTFAACRDEIARLLATDGGALGREGGAALARAETLISICKERTPSSSWPVVVLHK
jgi:hypothetical protein